MNQVNEAKDTQADRASSPRPAQGSSTVAHGRHLSNIYDHRKPNAEMI